MGRISKNDLNYLSDFEIQIDGEEFERLVIKNGGSKRTAEYLWNRFYQKGHNILSLWERLDYENMKLVTKVINDWIGKKSEYVKMQRLM